jgi:predicted transcriptional regulator
MSLAVLIAATAIVALSVAWALRWQRRQDGDLARRLLLALEQRRYDDPAPTIEELARTVGVRSTSRLRRAVALLQSIGLVTQSDARIVFSQDHVWVQRHISLVANGLAPERSCNA